MIVLVVFISHSLFSLIELASVFVRSRSFSTTKQYFQELLIMSNLSVESISSCEIAGSDYDLLKPKSPNLSTKSEVVCTFSFKEPRPGTSFVISGVILRTCERFSINILSVSNRQDIALHVNPRLPQNYIVRNSKISGKLFN